MTQDSGDQSSSRFDEPVVRLICQSTAGEGYDDLAVCVIELTQEITERLIKLSKLNCCLAEMDNQFAASIYDIDFAWWYGSADAAWGYTDPKLTEKEQMELEDAQIEIEDATICDCEWLNFPIGLIGKSDDYSSHDLGRVELNNSYIWFTCYCSGSYRSEKVESQGLPVSELEIYLEVLKDMKATQINVQRELSKNVTSERTRAIQINPTGP